MLRAPLFVLPAHFCVLISLEPHVFLQNFHLIRTLAARVSEKEILFPTRADRDAPSTRPARAGHVGRDRVYYAHSSCAYRVYAQQDYTQHEAATGATGAYACPPLTVVKVVFDSQQ